MRIKIMAVVPEASRLYTYSFTMVSLPDSKMRIAKDAHMAIPDFDAERQKLSFGIIFL